MRRGIQAVGMALFAALFAIQVLIPTPVEAGKKWTPTAVPNVMAWGATLEWGGFQTSGDFIYGHEPGGGDYAVKGAWTGGTVLEARGYFVENSIGDVYAATRWRTRNGGTAVLSAWNTGGSNSGTFTSYDSFTTHFEYGRRDNYPDYLDTSAILLQSYPDCSTVAGVDTYGGGTYDVTANPNGSLPVSGSKLQLTDLETNNIMDCGEQA